MSMSRGLMVVSWAMMSVDNDNDFNLNSDAVATLPALAFLDRVSLESVLFHQSCGLRQGDVKAFSRMAPGFTVLGCMDGDPVQLEILEQQCRPLVIS